MINLLGNAIKFTDEGGVTLNLTYELLGDKKIQYAVAITDTGYGIAPSETEKVFSYFEQTESGRTVGGGTGLGLPISRGFAKKMGGNISFTSTKNIGSTFRFTFVAELPEETEAATTAKSSIKSLTPETAGKLVLIADDNKNNRDVLSTLLRDVGYQVITATTGIEAIKLFEEFEAEILVLEHMMPEMTGAEAIEEIRIGHKNKDVPIIIVSGDVMGRSHKLSMDAGANDFVAKPYEGDELLEKIGALCGGKYLYEDNNQSIAPLSDEELINFLSELDKTIVNSLREKLSKGLMHEFNKTLKLTGKINGQAAKQLKAIADDYNYDKLQQILGGTEK